MSAGAERNILTPEGSQFAVAKARLNRDQKQRSVPAANPCSCIRGGHEGGGLFLCEKLDRSMLTAFRRNGKNTLALKTQCRLADRDEPEEGTSTAKGGSSMTCRVSTMAPSPAPSHTGRRFQAAHDQPRGQALPPAAGCFLDCPFCPPRFLPLALRNDFGFLRPSDDGGLIELWVSLANRPLSSATSADSASFSG